MADERGLGLSRCERRVQGEEEGSGHLHYYEDVPVLTRSEREVQA